MRPKTTKKAVMNGFPYVIGVPYCALQNLLTYKDPIAYTAGVYGWNADVYVVDDVAIVTGYRYFGNYKPSYETIKKYETLAAEKAYPHCDLDTAKKESYALLMDFIKEVTNQ